MASSKASVSWSRAAIRTSGTKRPPQSPKWPSGSGRWATSAAPGLGASTTSRSDIKEIPRQVVLVGLEVEVAVAAEVEDDRLGTALLLAAQRLVDHGPDGVGRLGGREDALGAGELHRRLEDLGLRVGDGLDVVLLAQQRHQRRVAVVAQPAGVDRGRDEVGPEGVHGHQRGHAGLVAEVVLEAALGQGRGGGRLDRHHPGGPAAGQLLGQQREGEAAEVGPAADPGESASWSSTARPALVSGDGDGTTLAPQVSMIERRYGLPSYDARTM